MASERRGRGRTAAIVFAVGVVLLVFAVISGTVLHGPEDGADIGGGLAGLLGVVLLLVAAGMGIGQLVAGRRGR